MKQQENSELKKLSYPSREEIRAAQLACCGRRSLPVADGAAMRARLRPHMHGASERWICLFCLKRQFKKS